MIRRAKVTLVKGKTYTLASRKFIRNVPVVVRGSDCDEFKNNGRFSCVEMEPAKKKKKKVIIDEDTSGTETETSKSSKKKKKKKKIS